MFEYFILWAILARGAILNIIDWKYMYNIPPKQISQTGSGQTITGANEDTID